MKQVSAIKKKTDKPVKPVIFISTTTQKRKPVAILHNSTVREVEKILYLNKFLSHGRKKNVAIFLTQQHNRVGVVNLEKVVHLNNIS